MENNAKLLDQLRSQTIKAIIFDFDGTLLDMKDAMQKAIQETFETNRIEADMELTIQEIGALVETLQGYPLPKIILNSYELVKQITAFEKLTFIKKILISTQIFSKYLEYAKESPIFPSTESLLKTLSKKCKSDLYIVSHSKKDNILFHLEKNGIKKYFKGIYGTDDLPALKPHPNAFEPAIKDYPISIQRSQFVMVGDMPSDIEAGQEAEFKTIGIASGVSNRDVLANLNPDILVGSLNELNELIKNENAISKSKESLSVKS